MNTRKLQITLVIILIATLISTAAYAYVGQDFLKGQRGTADKTKEVAAIDQKDVEAKSEPKEKANQKVESKAEVSIQENGDAQQAGNGTVNKDENNQSQAGAKAAPDQDKSGINNGNNTAGKSLARILAEKNISTPIPDLKIVVDKTDLLLTLYSGATPLKSYHVAIGEGGIGDKERSGDHRTPEGTFYISEKSVLTPADQYLGTRWMRVSYPNVEDAQRGLRTGLIDQATYDQIVQANQNGTTPPQKTNLGGGVGIHGGSGYPVNQGDYWTWGCVGLTDKDVEEIFDYITVGTPLIIQH